MSRYDLRKRTSERYFVDTMYGTYGDVLFILFPFLVMALQRVWGGQGMEVLKEPDLSIAAAILAGLGVGKFVLGLIGERDLGRYKERIVFFIAVSLFFVLGPALILIIKIVGPDEVPEFVVFVQPVLLIIAIALYSTAVSISNMLTRAESDSHDDDDMSDDSPKGAVPAPLVIESSIDK